MRQIIEGKKYDTETAILIGESDNLGRVADSVTDFKYWTAGLYKTKNGRFFLAGEGGAMSMFSQPAGQNASSGGSGIIPLSTEEAREWAEQHLSPETVEAEFGDFIEDA